MKHPLVALITVALVGCHQSEPSINEKNASVAEVSNSVQRASAEGRLRFTPGKWLSTVTFDEMSMPGLPPAAAKMMQRQMGTSQTTESCLTPEEANKPTADFFSGKQNCRYDHFKMGGGKIDAKMVCSHGDANQTFELDGTYSSDEYHMAMKGNVPGPDGQTMTMKMHVDAKHAGACTAKES
jgi:hypothetical protein